MWLNRARATLVACAAFAALLLALSGQTLSALLLTFALAAHGMLWLSMWKGR